MTGQVQGKVALVTGGASGIGAAVAELLAREGALVAITDIDELKGEELLAAIKKAGHKAIFLHQDVTSEARWVEVVAEVEQRFGRLDILVSNAGIGISVPSIVDMSLEDWRRQTAINLDGVFLSVKHCLPVMRKTGGGSIIMPGQLRPSRHYRHADMGQDSNGSGGQRQKRADRSGRARENRHPARPRRPRLGNRARRLVSGVRCIGLCDGNGARD